MRWTGKGHVTTPNNHVVYYSGKDIRREHGVAFIANSVDVARCVLGYKPVNERIIIIRLQGTPMNIPVVQACAPTSTSTEEEIKTFYDDLQKVIDGVNKRDRTIVT
ncbi:craniofacial development protein 2-like [Amphiura filiformis]|uniref:craniofacial development protein 2-like n=1 Tax=Amphiura filiformis TaxID=82378 RepID=UPI003B223E27